MLWNTSSYEDRWVRNNDRMVIIQGKTEEPLEKYVAVSYQNAGQNHDIKIANRCFENVEQFRYLGTIITNQNLIQAEISRRLNSGNACYH
jgi:hypothetical protein